MCGRSIDTQNRRLLCSDKARSPPKSLCTPATPLLGKLRLCRRLPWDRLPQATSGVSALSCLLLFRPGNRPPPPTLTFHLERRFAAKRMFACSPPGRQEALWDEPCHREPRDQSSGFPSSQLGYTPTRPHTAHPLEVAGVRSECARTLRVVFHS